MTISSSAKKKIERLGAVLALLLGAGCGARADQPTTPDPIVQSGPERPGTEREESLEGVELTVRTAAGEWIHIGDLRGQPVLLVFVATYDGVSQAALVPLRRIATVREDVQVIGVLVQQEADELVDAWVHALDPPFPVGYEPDGLIASGESAIGLVETVPTIIALDANGVIVERRIGYQGERALNEMIDAARAHAPVGLRQPPPLLGTSHGH
ncbi:MAG: TlpA family protein disulfide reductase [Polyangiaceae bacterium]|nr:TlpA family protein disulfide reductase [Polyangiaceae bacterium]